ncbi:hypothetical protein T439DRAFT_325368 [Meredithblackwellia eburnea MCA 4105]
MQHSGSASGSAPASASSINNPSSPAIGTTSATATELPSRKSTTLSMSSYLALHRSKQSDQHQQVLLQQQEQQQQEPVPQHLLIRDILFILQGIDGQFVRFKSKQLHKMKPRKPPHRKVLGGFGFEPDDDEEGRIGLVEDGIMFVLDGTGLSIPATTRDLIHTSAELGWLYRKVDGAINDRSTSAGARGGRKVGMVEQSLHSALKKEMTEYYRLIAVLEGQVGKDEEAEDAGEDVRPIEGLESEVQSLKGGLTLRRLLVWTQGMLLRMRMMGTLIGEVGNSNVGGALLTSLHSRTSVGDPFISTFSSTLLSTLSVPFFSTLASWIYEGELKDPFEEFFVELNPALADGGMGFGEEKEEGEGTLDLWQMKFRFRKEMLPAFLDDGFGRKIFSTGKSLNFMKYSCHDAAWVTEQNRDHQRRVLSYADLPGLSRSISLAYSDASQRLFQVLFDKFRLMDHLQALRDYMLLGKGDFMESLMESLGDSLNRPANNLYRHNLTSNLETALRSSSSTSPPDVLRRLDACMPQSTPGEQGWDVFILEYKVSAPLDTVLDPASMEEYAKVFKFLWGVKRVEWVLGGTWRRVMTGARTFLRVPALAYHFHTLRLSLSKMLYFIRQLQYYNHLEIILCAWNQFLKDIGVVDGESGEGESERKAKERDLDSLIAAHKVFLGRVVGKCLLRDPGRQGRKQLAVSMLDQAKQIFATILTYQETAESLCNFALSEAGRMETSRDALRGIPSPILPPPPPSLLTSITNQLELRSAEFHEKAGTLIGHLGNASDLDLRFLGARLNFNYHFVPPPSAHPSA